MGANKKTAINDRERLATSPVSRDNDLQTSLKVIQSNLKAPKGQFNNFGKYNYRSAEDILEALKPHLKQNNLILTITENTLELGGYLVLESTATLSNAVDSISVKAQAGINPERKGMDIAQSFGSSSSYAKKYALGNLFLLDDTKDADSTTNPREVKAVKAKSKMTPDIYNNMLEYIQTGKGDIVASKLDNYTMIKEYKDKFVELGLIKK
jgi:hypothetical protein